MPEIKPCPFCGSTASIRIDDELQHETDIPNLVVACDNPICQVYQTELHDSQKGAITAWNRRATPPHRQGNHQERSQMITVLDFIDLKGICFTTASIIVIATMPFTLPIFLAENVHLGVKAFIEWPTIIYMISVGFSVAYIKDKIK